MNILLILINILSSDIQLHPVQQEDFPITIQVEMSGDKGFFVATATRLYHWDLSGRSVKKIGVDGPGFSHITSYYFDGEYYWLSGSLVKPNTLGSVLFGKDGKYLSHSEGPASYVRFFRPVGDRLFGQPALNEEITTEQPFFFMAREISYEIVDDRLNFEFSPGFCKVSPRLQKLVYNFKRVWLVERDGTYYVTNEVDPVIYIYDNEMIETEMKEGPKAPGKAKSHKLALERFITGEKIFALSKPVPTREIYRLQWNWFCSWSRIIGFSAYKSGFLIGYDIPDCDEEGDCRSLLGIQTLDNNFRNRGEPLITEGFLAGTFKGKVYILQPNFDEAGYLKARGMAPTVSVLEL